MMFLVHHLFFSGENHQVEWYLITITCRLKQLSLSCSPLWSYNHQVHSLTEAWLLWKSKCNIKVVMSALCDNLPIIGKYNSCKQPVSAFWQLQLRSKSISIHYYQCLFTYTITWKEPICKLGVLVDSRKDY